MSKKTAQLRAVLVEDNILVRGSGALINGVAVRKAKVFPDQRARLGEIMRRDDPWFEQFGQVYFTTTYPGVVKALARLS
ncbi:MAG: hypothetical protein U5K33_04035 [Halofilum sp. (in: g-proteobacteria)]|nr:hypothetical protein [Halofilum sp. (in: g-proteobacteria)]